MRASPAITVLASGMVTALGFNAQTSCAALRARVPSAETGNLWNAQAGEYLCCSKVPMPQWWEGPDMLAELAAPAVAECLAVLPAVERRAVPVQVVLAAPDRPARHPDVEAIVARELFARLRGVVDRPPLVASTGSCGTVDALRRAAGLFAHGHARHAVVVGVDSLLRQAVVDHYAQQRRVLTPRNSNGFIPGEAACAVLLGPADAGAGLQVLGWGEGLESGTAAGGTPVTGDGLTRALRQALDQAGLGMAQTDYWLTDQNAEHDKAKECTFAQIRLERRERPAPVPYQIWHPIEFLGEIGCAIGPCLLGVALAAARQGYAPGRTALMHVGDDGGRRAALVLRWTAPQEP